MKNFVATNSTGKKRIVAAPSVSEAFKAMKAEKIKVDDEKIALRVAVEDDLSNPEIERVKSEHDEDDPAQKKSRRN